MKLVYLFLVLCAVTTSHAKVQLSLESARGIMRLKNFLHLHKHRLKIKPMATLEVNKEMRCTGSCLKSPECFSFNVKKLSENNFLCELLNSSRYRYAENLTQDEGFSHWYLQDVCVPNPCNDGYCVPGKQTGISCDCRPFTAGQWCERYTEKGRNLALGKPTAQSTTYANVAYGSCGSQLAVDGNVGTAYVGNGQCQCAITVGGYDWWRVDFGETMPVARVVVTPRSDCCLYRMGDFEVKIGDNLGVDNPKCGDRHSASSATVDITCTPTMYGRYLVIQTQLDQEMQICEVEVYC